MGNSESQTKFKYKRDQKLSGEDIKKRIHQMFLNNKSDEVTEFSPKSVDLSIDLDEHVKVDKTHFGKNIFKDHGFAPNEREIKNILQSGNNLERIKDMLKNNIDHDITNNKDSNISTQILKIPYINNQKGGKKFY